MTAKMKQWVAMAVVAALVILAGGWFLLVSPKRSDAAALREQAADGQRANALLSSQIATLKAQAKDLPKQQARLAAVAAKIPDNSALPTLIRSLNAAAEDTGVELVSMSPAAPTAVAPAAPATTATTPTTSGSGAAASNPAGGTTAASGEGAAAVGTLQQIGVTLSVVGSYFQVAEYLDRLEGLSRAFRVSGFTLAPGLNPLKASAAQPTVDTGKVLTAAITGQVFQTTGATTSSLQTSK